MQWLFYQIVGKLTKNKRNLMFKIVGLITLSLLITGCGVDKGPSIKSNLYQSVNENEAILVQSGKDKRYCVICGMDLVKFYKTSHSSTHNGKNYQYCSIHCLEDHLGQGVTLKNPKVVDVASLKFISVANAYYVVGSKKRGTMSQVSKYAFSNKKDAEKFQAKFGGKIMDFNKAREVAQKDFKYYR
jgi:nitrous oxide reductase accessory protein NosL